MRSNVRNSGFNATDQVFEHVTECAFSSLGEGVYRLQLIHFEKSKLDMTNVNFITQCHRR